MPKVTELRPLCPVTLTLKDGSVFTWDDEDECFRNSGAGNGIVVRLWPTAYNEWNCSVSKGGPERDFTCGKGGPQVCFDAMVERARKEMHK